MAIVEKDNITLIKTALDENMKIEISFIGGPVSSSQSPRLEKGESEIRTSYHFIPTIIETPSSSELAVKCISYTSIRDDPLHLYGTTKTIDEFLFFITMDTIISKGVTYRIDTVSVYPFDWYECFESLKNDRIKDVEEILAMLKDKTEEIYTLNSDPSPESKRDEDRRTIQNFFMQSFDQA